MTKLINMRLDNFLLNLMIFLAIIFAMHTLHIWIGLIVESNFNSILSMLWAPILFAFLIITYLIYTPIQLNLRYKTIERNYAPVLFPKNILVLSLALILLSISVILICFGIDSTFLPNWALMTTGIVLIFLSSSDEKIMPEVTTKQQEDKKKRFIEMIALSGIGLMLVTLYLFSSISHHDDTHFVATIISLIQHPNTIIFSQDTIFNSGGKNEIYVWNYGQSWEAFIAIISVITGLNYLSVYYTYVPAFFLFFTPLPIFYFTKIYFPKYTLISVLFALIVLICWSDYNQMQGTYFIPRLYQGKAILLSFFLPLLFLIARSFFLTPNFKLGLVICLLLIASGGSSNTGLYVSILVLGICYLSFTPFNYLSFFRCGLLFLLIISPNLLMLGLAKNNIDSSKERYYSLSKTSSKSETIRIENLSDSIRENFIPIHSIFWLFGDHRYLVLIVSFFLLTFLLVSLNNSYQFKELQRFYLVLVVFALNHPLANFLGNLTGIESLFWRFHWIFPTSLILSLFSASLLNFPKELLSKKISRQVFSIIPNRYFQIYLFVPVIGILLLIMFKGVDHFSNSFDIKPVMYKTNIEALNIARDIVNSEQPADIILAAYDIAIVLPLLIRNSQLLTSIPLYWWAPYFSLEEVNSRKYLQHLIHNVDLWKNSDILFLKSEIQKRKINVIVFKQKHDASDVEFNQSYSEIFSDFKCSKYKNNWKVCRSKSNSNGQYQ